MPKEKFPSGIMSERMDDVETNESSVTFFVGKTSRSSTWLAACTGQFHSHLVNSIQKQAGNMKVNSVNNPDRLTSILQPLDICEQAF
jgi:hypothetical protein